MVHVAYCEGRKVCTVQRARHGKGWVIIWHSRRDAADRIASVTAAKAWVAQLLHGKQVDWRSE